MREKLDVELLNRIGEDLCTARSYLEEIKNLTARDYSGERTMNFARRRSQFEGLAMELEREKRKEYSNAGAISCIRKDTSLLRSKITGRSVSGKLFCIMNMMNAEEVLKKLKPIIGEKADELWYTWLASDFQERKELEIDIGIIAEKVLREGPLAEREILLSPPDESKAAGDFILGHVVYRGKKLFPLCLREEDLIKQIGIFSVTGGGKSNVAMLLCLELLRKGKVPFMVIDWKRQYRSMLSLKDFPNMEKLEIYTIGRDVLPFLWNPFRPPRGTDYKAWIGVIVECLEKSHLAGLGVGDIFTNIFTKLHESVKDDTFYPNFYDGMRELLKIKSEEENFYGGKARKDFPAFGSRFKIIQRKESIKLEELLQKPVILELDESLPKPLRMFIMK